MGGAPPCAGSGGVKAARDGVCSVRAKTVRGTGWGTERSRPFPTAVYERKRARGNEGIAGQGLGQGRRGERFFAALGMTGQWGCQLAVISGREDWVCSVGAKTG